MKKIFSIVSLVLCMGFLFSCSDDDDNSTTPTNEATKQRDAAVKELKTYEELTRFVQLLEIEDMSGSAATQLTVFAVENLEELDISATLRTSVYPGSPVVKRHVAEGNYNIETLKGLSSIKMLDGTELPVTTVGDNVYVGGTLVTPIYSTSSVSNANPLYRVSKLFSADAAISKRVSKIETKSTDGDVTMVFTYGDNGRLVSYTERYVDDEEDFETTSLFTFNDKNLLTKYEKRNPEGQSEDDAYIIDFTHKDDYTVAVVTEDGRERYKDTLYYVSSTASDALYLDRIQGTYNKYKCEYDANNNLVKFSSANELYEYTYNESNAILANTGIPLWFWIYQDDGFVMFTGKNNVASYKYTEREYESENYTYTYEYDDQGYPTKITCSDASIGTFTITYEVVE
ncbi:hypothetical protein [Dysgonomonas macrotermitis]|uniref:YD repeat-containing protein n=1 Tax=Dysgonomonas macrotermitis TaxID=1346286 RepID=A0A1M5HJF3_9BACT|nr:hypothetical protein [Dysgonomonas macrotermitis]SHG15952.1 YD repeat-containing protein [Dysgonomonas macrotermitis]